MSARQQYRVVFTSGEARGTAFVDAVDEAAARAFFAQAFPRSTVLSVALEPVNPCAAYERRQT